MYTLLTLAADSRLSRVDYADDQAWDWLPGALEAPALVLQTRYGGRVGLASLVPMWTFMNDRRTIYQAQAYVRPPRITMFAPGFARAEAALNAHLNLVAETWVMESHAVGTRYTLTNTGSQSISLRLDLFAQVGSQGKALKLAVVTLAGGLNALAFGNLGNLQPAVMLENANAQITPGKTASPKIGTDLTIPAGGSISVRWVHAGENDLRDSLALAETWLAQDWDAHFARIAANAKSIPVIQTGNADFDKVIALSYHQLAQSLMKGGGLPHPSLVATRQPASGYSPNGDGSDHDRAWSGQTPQLVYLTAQALTTIDPQLGLGLLRNFFAVQESDGSIDGKPGLGGQRQDLLALPILAKLTLDVYRLTQDAAFSSEALPKLQQFYERWLKQDADNDGLPEWISERQTGYVAFPMFGTGQQWAQNADIRYIESPDLAAYLVSEAASIAELAKSSAPDTSILAALWQNGRYAYRDRDTHSTNMPTQLLVAEGRADEAQVIALEFTQPLRLLVRMTGGTGKAPKITLSVVGKTADGHHITENADQIGWYRGYGVYVTKHTFTFVDRVEVEGLSRVYKIDVQTVDTTYEDINALLPLWTGKIPTEQAAELVKRITDPAAFWRPNGIPMTPAADETFDPSNAQGGGGIWLFWLTLIGEGLLAYGYTAEAETLLQRVLTMQAAVLQKEGRFHEFYNSDQPAGSGETGNLSGIAPLRLLHGLLEVSVLSSGQVLASGKLHWKQPVTIQQHGVTVAKSAQGTKITFPSGYTVELAPDAALQLVADPNPVAAIEADELAMPIAPNVEQATSAKVMIQVEMEQPVTKIKLESDESE